MNVSIAPSSIALSQARPITVAVLAMGGQPVEMLGAVVDRMETPEEADVVLQAMAPVDEQVAEQNDLDRLKPPRLRRHARAKRRRHNAVQPSAEA